uniref:UBIQUITIN_CONJUGAT_2 domain-containing protein n=1 Tax=Elaeophora elaphi TaxID=1147741 RepID=A0A0R3RXQ8_9BILA
MTANLPQYNLKSTDLNKKKSVVAGVKRLMKEAAELRNPTDMYYAQPLEDNLFEWHFTVRGPADTDFEGGIYHGRIILPVDYPMKPPSVILLTPNGRFQLNRKICLSISGHHPESWQPSWSIRTALLALIGFMPTHAAGALGSLEYPPEERRKLAKISHEWVCKECGLCMRNALASETVCSDNADAIEARRLATQISIKVEKEANKQEPMCDQNLFVASDKVLGNDITTDSSAVASGTLRHRQPSSQSRGASITSVNNYELGLASHRYSWQLIFIWFFSVIIISLIFRRLFFVQNGAIA